MRYKKIRGHKRRHRQLENWRLRNLDIREDLIETYQSDHIDIVVHPWCDLSLTNSAFPEPKRKTKLLMLSGLIDIYDSWKIQLDKLGKPYYLKIWIFEPRFTKSQVVCAVDERIDFYKNNFQSPEKLKVFKSGQYGNLKSRLDNFKWENKLDEEYYDNSDLGEPEDYLTLKDYEYSKKWFENLKKKPHRIEKNKNSDKSMTEYYVFKKGDLWIGEK
jgi:hypothetical protein